jgi:hypothetical protein
MSRVLRYPIIAVSENATKIVLAWDKRKRHSKSGEMASLLTTKFASRFDG